MSAYTDAERAILRKHYIECTGPGEVSCRGCRDAGWMSWTAYYDHLLDAVAPAIAAHALREAADAVAPALQNEVGGHTSTYSVRQWLRHLAYEIERTA